MASGTFGAQSQDLTVSGDLLVLCHTADGEVRWRSLAIEHSIAFRVEEVLRWIQTVHQLATVESLRGICVTPTGEHHVVILEDFRWKHGESGR